MVSFIIWYVFMDPKDSVIIRLTCTKFQSLFEKHESPRGANTAVFENRAVLYYTLAMLIDLENFALK